MRSQVAGAVVLWVLCVGVAGSAWAQAAPVPTPPKTWTVNISAGLTFTSGNTDTSTLNAGYDLAYDPHRSNLVKSDALLLRGKSDGVSSADRLNWNARDEYRISQRFSLFAGNQYVRDTFKQIRYLAAPTAGIAYAVGDEATTHFEMSGGAGGVWEKDTDTALSHSGSLSAAEKFTCGVTATTTLNESTSVLWKTGDFADSLYTFTAGLAASVSTHTQMKFDVLDTFKNKPPAPSRRNDVAVVLAFVYKN